MIYFNDPCSSIGDLQNCGGALAYGGPAAAGSHSFDGSNWWTCTGWRVVVNNGAGCLGDDGYRIMLAHELGHGLGYGHLSDPSSLMNAFCCRPMDDTDRMCTQYTYPASDPGNQRPQVEAGSDLNVLLCGNAIRLHGTVTDDGLPASPGRVTSTWTKLGGPGTATFGDPSAIETTVSFSESGRYLLGLTASDGQLLRTDPVSISADVRVGSRSVLTFQQGSGGYRGTADTRIQENSPTSNNGAALQLSVDADDPSSSGLKSEVLLRFDGIFGAAGNQVPAGIPIRAAWLELTTTDPGDGATLHRMVRAWSDTASWTSFGGDGIQAGTEALGSPEATVVGLSGKVRIDVTKSVAAWSADPCSNHGWVFLPTGKNGWDFSSAEGADPPRLAIEFITLREDEMIKVGDAWSYFKGTRAPPAGWTQVDFAPGPGWLTGRTGIGYGDNDDATVLQDMQGSYPTIFCRREFQVADASAIGRLLLSIDYDDGFVAYLNGSEVARSPNMGLTGTPVAWNALAAATEAGIPDDYPLLLESLRNGKNVLAVEVHNSALDSSDLSFIPALRASHLLIDGGALWKYLRGSQPVPADWNSPDFDDSSWSSGPAGIGYGNGDELTDLADMKGKYLTVFCRRSFEVTDPTTLGELQLTVIHDDGFVAYVNGAEVGRINMPTGAATRTTPAKSAIEPTKSELRISTDRLRAGTNVLAVSVHNAALDSSDLTFDAVLLPFTVHRRVIDCEATFRRGDVGSDDSIDISDVIRLLLYLFVEGNALPCADAADIDDDGELRITDAIGLLNFLFAQGPPPRLPGPVCGVDPTVDGFDDCSTVGCRG